MEDQRLQRIYDLFLEAAELPADEQEPFVAARCHDDPSVAAEVMKRLGGSDSGETLVERVRDLAAEEFARIEAAPLPRRIGRFRITGRLGQGGMGTVYEAAQSEPVERPAAVKVINLGLDDDAAARFAREQQALALMQHPGIARVYDCGVTEQGQPFLAMELVRGKNLTRHCDAHRLPIERRLRLMIQLCDAVQHAHQKGFVHRDLKPDNALVTGKEPESQIKVIDFGLAKSLKQVLPMANYRTRTGGFGGGTLVYMAPEQAIDAEVDTLADIYALGVILYELLVGSLPLQQTDLSPAGEAEFVQRLRQQDPDRPSRRLTTTTQTETVLERRQTTGPKLQRALAQDLDWVVLKALRKNPADRYRSAAELGSDLTRFLRQEPVLAGPPTTAYRVSKFVRRNRGRLASAAALVLMALATGVVGVVSAIALERQVSEFKQLEGVVRLRNAVAERETKARELPSHATTMAEWAEQTTKLLDSRPDFHDAHAALTAAATTDQTTGILTFADPAEGFLHQELGQLLHGLDRLEQNDVPDVERRRRWQALVRAASLEQPTAREAWQRFDAAVKAPDSRYRATGVHWPESERVGFVPIGLNQRTGLWEFYHLRSAWDGSSDPASIAIPRHEEGGVIRIRRETGIVFVLLPGGSFAMGANKSSGPNQDPWATKDELPTAEVELAPFLLARHELTRGQWQRLGGPRDIFWHKSDPLEKLEVTDNMPAESMDRVQGQALLWRHGLSLPTEAQWEYGCRAGTQTPWWCAAEPAQMIEFENLAAPVVTVDASRLLDTHKALAPVGSFDANEFGLHDVHGNVAEWCVDAGEPYQGITRRAGDGRVMAAVDNKDDIGMCRGGCYLDQPERARSASRQPNKPTYVHHTLGLRPTRALHAPSER